MVLLNLTLLSLLPIFQVYMFAEWYKPGCTLEYPLHGTGAIVDALVQGIQKFGGRLSLGSHVEKIIVENGKATGVKLKGGQVNIIRMIDETELKLNKFSLLEMLLTEKICLCRSLYVLKRLLSAMHPCGTL